MFLKRFLYLLYFIKKTDFNKFLSDISFSSKKTGKSSISIFLDSLCSVFKYNISLEDYFIFSFFEKDPIERSKWAGTGYMYEYQKLMNKADKVPSLEDKIIFLEKYSDFVHRKWFVIESREDLERAISCFKDLNLNKIVAKYSKGQTGSSVEVISIDKNPDIALLYKYFVDNRYNLVEAFVTQCDYLNNISSSGLNTIRIITQIKKDGTVEILGARLRLTVNSPVDNLSAGNFALALDSETGKAISSGIYMNIQKDNIDIHPVSGFKISEIEIPNWLKIKDFIHEVALLDTDLRSVGWDIAITEDSIELIEGNHNWGKTLYQLPINTGCKNILEDFK
ncbi:sugar-transfer associated ATP-grasp domain-containing protein [Acinetobacter indicus]|uniref:sugar-transfer associated ATP-grasp domain-containing protein n=1 Tax=Acinetobacter indicus TaxID=756892 RepID=UPI000CEC6D29|nr:sugar-transfer associated ATP-grasp domain-containing protein [Acinetobacter indicus]